LASPFETEIVVRFGDCDPAGIVYYPTLYHYSHVAFEDAWRVVLDVPYPDLVAHDRIGYPTVHVETDFLSPARYGDTVVVRVTISRVGSSSVVFDFEGRIGDRTLFRSSHTKVCLDLTTFTSRRVPESHGAAFARLVT
jgi:YbgC/YbaW family acyl-CoA thioester hydrolase